MKYYFYRSIIFPLKLANCFFFFFYSITTENTPNMRQFSLIQIFNAISTNLPRPKCRWVKEIKSP